MDQMILCAMAMVALYLSRNAIKPQQIRVVKMRH
jgi:hypothetical protein